MIPDGNESAMNAPDLLADAINRAIREGLLEAERLRATVESTLDALGRTTQLLQADGIAARPIGVGTAVGDLLKRVAGVLQARQKDIQRVFDAQREALGSVNLVLFGRTGAGKSSLVEALTRGTGQSVSPDGRSDFTTEVDAAVWRGCRVYDTPGTQGWSQKQSELEDRARKAAEIADIVFLAFDSQSQQDGEFEKIARWVLKYRKPTIALLNVRNATWRRPDRVSDAGARRNLSQTIREHRQRVVAELERLGLPGVPLIAYHSQRAMFARTREPYRGPMADLRNKQRTGLGVERLAKLSNITALEELVATALEHSATALRLGMLRAEVGSLLRATREELDGLAGQLGTELAQVERFVESTLKVIGYPAPGARAGYSFGDGRASDLLTLLERLRGEPFQSPVTGEVPARISRVVATYFGPVRLRSRSEAERLVANAFDNGCQVDEAEFEREVFDRKALDTAVEKVSEDVLKHLEARLRLEVRDLEADLEAVLRGASFDGSTGGGWRKVGTGLRLGGLLVGAGSAAAFLPSVAAAIVAAGGPPGWIVGLALGFVSGVLGWFSRKSREKAERERLKARSKALADAVRSVDSAFDHLESKLVTALRERTAVVGAEVLLGPLRMAVAGRTLASELATTSSVIIRVADGMPAHENPIALLEQAGQVIVRRQHPGDPAGAFKTWLGEDWLDDPVGLRDAGPVAPSRAAAADPGLLERIRYRLRSLLGYFDGDLAPGAGAVWLESARASLVADAFATEALAELEEIRTVGKPRIHVVGDYSSGKSSFIKRLLVDVGQQPPASLEVRADPTTAAAHVYEWEGLLLVDTPGFQSGNPDHTRIATESIADASAIVMLFQPNLLSGATEYVKASLLGDMTRGLSGKLARTLFVVHRSDEFGADPEECPAEYERLCASKASELVHALGSRGIEVNADRVFCLAGDPFQHVGARLDVTSRDYDQFRRWDGMDAFLQAFRSERERIRRAGVEYSILEGGIARLVRLSAEARSRIAAAERSAAVLERLLLILDDGLSNARILQASLRSEAERLVDDHAATVKAEALEARDEAAIKACGERLSVWWTDPPFVAAIERWQHASAADVERWWSELASTLDRRLGSAEFKAVRIELERGQFSGAEKAGRTASRVGQFLDVVGKAVAKAGKTEIGKVAKAIGMRFKPWGLGKFATKVRYGGGIIAVIGIGFDLYAWYREARAEKDREQARQRVHQFVEDSRARIVHALLEGDSDEPGVLARMNALLAQLEPIRSDASALREVERARIADDTVRLARYDQFIDSARERLLPTRATEVA